MTFWLMVVHHNTKFGYKRLHTNTQPSGNKYVSQALHLSPLKTPQCFPFSSQIIHHTQKEVKRCCCKSADVDWYVRVGRKSVTKFKNKVSCFSLIFISSGKWHPLWSSFQENDPYMIIRTSVNHYP